jgi:hypothetical protein
VRSPCFTATCSDLRERTAYSARHSIPESDLKAALERVMEIPLETT